MEYIVLGLFLIAVQINQCNVTLAKSLNILYISILILERIWITFFFLPHILLSFLTKKYYSFAGRNINNLRYADDTNLMAESEQELKSLLMKVKEES